MVPTELHVQAALWTDHGWWFATLYMEGESPDRANGVLRADALYRAARARGLRLTTDLGLVSLRPVPGWRIEVTAEDAVTVAWPHARPLLAEVPLMLPDRWRDAAYEHGIVLVFVGHGLGLHEHAVGAVPHTGARLRLVAEDGDLVAGAVRVVGSDIAATRLDGTIRRLRRVA
jgi:hypothetical protein